MKPVPLSAALFHSLAARLLLWFLLLSLLPLAILGLGGYYNAKTSMQHEAMDKLVGLARHKAQRLEGYFIETANHLVSLSRSDAAKQALQQAETALKEGGLYSQEYAAVGQIYDPILKNNTETGAFQDLFLITADGMIVFTLAKESDLGGNLITGTYRDSELGKLFGEVMTTHHTAISDFAFIMSLPTKSPALPAPLSSIKAGCSVYWRCRSI
ncbi:MAG: hypothetical protein CO187_04310 [Zetaproteobacteria bacterium CG_4_9_14_3_um_filter_53_7]|nr:MAG: hypothetical protein CO187_04310 [Zetaproteobacteria bacterium CG_4_9_14_3_um_filter_53_7]